MKPQRLQKIDKVFQFALDLPGERRSQYLDAACGGDADLRAEVESLLAAHQEAGSFIEDSASDVAAVLLGRDRALSAPGQQVGQYKIEALLGAGGGAVSALPAWVFSSCPAKCLHDLGR